MMLKGGGFATYGKLPSQYVCVFVCTWCVFGSVSANLQCMHIFEIGHMFICVKLKGQCVPSACL